MSWEDIVKKDRNEITDALLIVEDMLQKKYNIALDRVKTFLERYLERTGDLQWIGKIFSKIMLPSKKLEDMPNIKQM